MLTFPTCYPQISHLMNYANEIFYFCKCCQYYSLISKVLRIGEGRKTHCLYSRINISHEPMNVVNS